MYILTLSDDINQSFSFSSDLYNTTIYLKCPEVDCGFSTVPLIDIYVDGFQEVLGLPLIHGVDILSEHVSSGCLPFDYGAIMALDRFQEEITCERFFEGLSYLVYFNAAEALTSSLVF